MKALSLLVALVISTPFVFADDKKSGNNLRVKINHKWGKFNSIGNMERYEFQFKYDTEEWLFITDQPESTRGVYLRRNEVGKFKAIIEKMLKFADTVHTNQIKGVKKEFKGEKEIPKQIYGDFTYVDINEDVKRGVL